MQSKRNIHITPFEYALRKLLVKLIGVIYFTIKWTLIMALGIAFIILIHAIPYQIVTLLGF